MANFFVYIMYIFICKSIHVSAGFIYRIIPLSLYHPQYKNIVKTPRIIILSIYILFKGYKAEKPLYSKGILLFLYPLYQRMDEVLCWYFLYDSEGEMEADGFSNFASQDPFVFFVSAVYVPAALLLSFFCGL